MQGAIQNPAQYTDPIVANIADRLSSVPTVANQQAIQRVAAQPAAPATPGESSTTVMRQTKEGGADGAILACEARTRTNPSEIPQKIATTIQEMWSHLDVGALIKQALWDLIWPWPGVDQDWKALTQDLDNKVKSFTAITSFDDLIVTISLLKDIPLIIWRHTNSILGRLSGWFTIGCAVVGGVIGAPFGGVFALPGMMAGFALAGEVGMVLAASTAAELGQSGLKSTGRPSQCSSDRQ